VTDWLTWHEAYDDPGSRLAARLGIVQHWVRTWLDADDGRERRVVSLCAGQGRDLLEVLPGHPAAERVRAVLIELDERNVELARRAAAAAGLDGIEVRCADASRPATFSDATPADLLVCCGIFGNVSEDDVRTTVAALPAFCAPGATVLWTRGRRAPDVTPSIRGWFAAAGFAELAFEAPEEYSFSVGVNRLVTPSAPPVPEQLFTFRPRARRS
jgi:hypothetical protein